MQKYIRSQALAHGVPVIRNYSLDQAIAGVIDLVVQRSTEHLASKGVNAPDVTWDGTGRVALRKEG